MKLSLVLVVFAVLLGLVIRSSFGPRGGCPQCISAAQLAPSYDFVVIGGGTAGSILATKLASQHTVLLIEAGARTDDATPSEQTIPGLAADNVAHASIDWRLQSEPQTVQLKAPHIPGGMDERRIPIPRGKVVGGSNELNFMLHVRGTPADYNLWANRTNDTEWGAASMAAAEDELERLVSPYTPPSTHPIASAWLQASGLTKWGEQKGGSYNSREHTRVGGHLLQHDVLNGRRHSTARAFLLPEMQRQVSKLSVLLHTQVSKLQLDKDNTVTGVQVRVTEGGESVDLVAHATKEVLLCAGAYHSPHILLHSGIGPAHELNKHDIPQRLDLPVGQGLQDHLIVGLKYRIGSDTGSWWPLALSKLNVLANPLELYRYFAQGGGVLATSGVNFGFFAASSDEYNDRPDLQVHGIVTGGDTGFFHDFLKLKEGFTGQIGESTDYSSLFSDGFVVAPTLNHPESVGTVTLRSSDPFADPVITLDALSNVKDLKRIVQGIRITQQIVSQAPMQRLGATLLPHKALEAEFGKDTDTYWEEYVKRFGFWVYHPVGTCKMGLVVDARLRVKGVGKLRVVDASVMPELPSGNTNIPTAAIAIKAAELIARDHPLSFKMNLGSGSWKAS